MHINTVEFYDAPNKDYRIKWSNAHESTNRVDTIMKPTSLWFHYDISKYSKQQAVQALRLENMETHLLQLEDHIARTLEQIREFKLEVRGLKDRKGRVLQIGDSVSYKEPNDPTRYVRAVESFINDKVKLWGGELKDPSDLTVIIT